jgi:hypothetical protein
MPKKVIVDYIISDDVGFLSVLTAKPEEEVA